MKPILEIQNISKKFRIQHEQQPYLSVRDSLMSLLKASPNTSEDFYALNGISFDVNPGDSIGIIGKNGAGKSTLLKILSKITPPTSGKIISRGRIASLLEVGTGFHGELSGRENIFLNGSILGMKRKEIQAKFDEIVDFSGVKFFLDTPLKHYSSGMQLRLAFAVAAFLEPEILVIDEVLAVGDAEFQKKCMGKMQDVTQKEGRTILFVSHNLQAVKNLCSRGILLKEGSLVFDGAIPDLLNAYLSKNKYSTTPGEVPDDLSSYGSWQAKIKRVQLLGINGDLIEDIPYSSPLHFKIIVESKELIKEVMLDIKCLSNDGLVISNSNSVFDNSSVFDLQKGSNSFEVKIENFLLPGQFSTAIGLHHRSGTTIDYLENFITFNVLPVSEDGSNFPFWWVHGYVRLKAQWNKLD